MTGTSRIGLHIEPRWPLGLAVVLPLVALVGATIPVIALAPYDGKILLLVILATALGAAWLIPRMAEKEPSVGSGLVTTMLAARIVAALVSYLVFVRAYGGVADAFRWHEAGLRSYEMVRSLDFSFLQAPFLGTDFMEYLTPFVYAIIGPSLSGSFVLFSLASFAGSWWFYRAHRTAFPDGNSRLLFPLLFLMPSLVFWSSNLGKDAVSLCGLGLATFGLARLTRRFSPGAFAQLGLGGLLVFLIRPPVGVMLAAASIAALLIHPGRRQTALSRPIAWLLLAPALAIGLQFAVRQTGEFLQEDRRFDSLAQYVEIKRQALADTKAGFDVPIPETPAGLAWATVTVLFRPFPWEIGSAMGVIAGAEGIALMVLIAARLRPAGRSLRLWSQGMIVAVYLMAGSLLAALSGFANFGLLARQRAQLLPFVFLILTAAGPGSTPSPSRPTGSVQLGDRRRARRAISESAESNPPP